MILLPLLLPITILQVGPNPQGTSPLGVPDELVNRPARTVDASPPDPTSIWLSSCLTLIESDPARAHTQAQIRRGETSGAQRVIANHCLGIAATELGLWQDARTAFLAARDETPADEVRVRARFGAMAGNAALASGDADGALALLMQARSDAEAAASAPLQAVAALDLARALVALERPDEALQPLETATSLAPQDAEGWLLKATLLRRLDRLGDAQAAIERAVTIAPQEGAIGLEAGVIAVLSGRQDAARTSWQSVIDTQPDSAAAQAAKGYLDQVGPQSEAPQPESALQ